MLFLERFNTFFWQVNADFIEDPMSCPLIMDIDLHDNYVTVEFKNRWIYNWLLFQVFNFLLFYKYKYFLPFIKVFYLYARYLTIFCL